MAASAVALPGLLKVKAALLAKVLWRVASYRFPVAMGAYVTAALAARFVVSRIQVRDYRRANERGAMSAFFLSYILRHPLVSPFRFFSRTRSRCSGRSARYGTRTWTWLIATTSGTWTSACLPA